MSALKIKREGIIDKYVVLLNKEGWKGFVVFCHLNSSNTRKNL
jgi:hypothetical protein